ncbi:hypothetical protein EBU71_03875 [bacterium]|nr:hypothetical protein [Candidatus Elulimicrobium humile]
MSTKSVYDIKISSWDKQDTDLLSKYKNKVTLIINVTADCGNAPQYGIIETIYRKYKDNGFEVIAVPTNDYCGTGITYGEYCDGIKNAEDARDYAIDTYDVSYNFTELVTSNPGPAVDKEFIDKMYRGRTEPFPRQLEEDEEVHQLYKALCGEHIKMFGNFEKFLIDKNGTLRFNYTNGTLMEYAHKTDPDAVGTADEEYERLCSDIEKLLAE